MIVNLTPHALNIHTADEVLEVAPSGTVARCTETRADAGSVAGIPVTVATYGEVTGLPEPAPQTIYVVSALVLSRVPHRADVFAPGEAVRDADGKIVGCKGLSGTPAMLNAPTDPAPTTDDSAPAPVETTPTDDTPTEGISDRERETINRAFASARRAYPNHQIVLKDGDAVWVAGTWDDKRNTFSFRSLIVKDAYITHDVCGYCGHDHGVEGRRGYDCEYCGAN